MNLVLLLDVINLILILFGLLTIFMTGFLSNFMKMNISFDFSVISIFVSGFLLANFVTDINQMRFVVSSLFLFVIIPWIISFLMIWMHPRETTILRTKMATITGWLIGLTMISGLRFLFGWGFESISTFVVIGLILSILNGLLSGIIGNYLIYKAEKINPSRK